MADNAPAAQAGAPPAKKGGGDKIMGMDKTGFIVLVGAVGVGMIWFLTKGKSQNQGSGQGGQGGHQSPTGLKREHLVIWVRNHGGHGRHK